MDILLKTVANVVQLGNARVFGFDESLGLHGGQFGNINTLASVCTIIFEVPWVMAVKRWGAKKAIGTSFVLWSACTLGTAFINTYGQAIAVRMLLNAAEAGLAQGFAFLFSTIYPPALAGKRIMTTNLAQCISGAFGGLFAYAIQTMGSRNGLEAWRWLFIVEFLITVFVCGIGLCFLPDAPETAWFLNDEEKATMRLKKERDFLLRGKDKFERKWIKIALTDPFVYLLGIAFFTSSVAINGFGVFLPTIIAGLGSVARAVSRMRADQSQICLTEGQLHDYSRICRRRHIFDSPGLLFGQDQASWSLHHCLLRSSRHWLPHLRRISASWCWLCRNVRSSVR